MAEGAVPDTADTEIKAVACLMSLDRPVLAVAPVAVMTEAVASVITERMNCSYEREPG